MTSYVTVTADDVIERDGAIKLYDEAGFAGMRKAGALAATILDALVPHVVPGVTTEALDDIVRRMTIDAGGVPGTLGYRGYTKSSCISINHVVCHGIPAGQAAQGRRHRQYRRDARCSTAGTATPAGCISSATCRSRPGGWSR